MDNLESRTKQRLLRDKQRCRSYRTPDIPQLLHETDETTWHSPIEISRSAPQFRDTLHRKQMRLQDRERNSRTRRHIHNPQPLCPPPERNKRKNASTKCSVHSDKKYQPCRLPSGCLLQYKFRRFANRSRRNLY